MRIDARCYQIVFSSFCTAQFSFICVTETIKKYTEHCYYNSCKLQHNIKLFRIKTILIICITGSKYVIILRATSINLTKSLFSFS